MADARRRRAAGCCRPSRTRTGWADRGRGRGRGPCCSAPSPGAGTEWASSRWRGLRAEPLRRCVQVHPAGAVRRDVGGPTGRAPAGRPVSTTIASAGEPLGPPRTQSWRCASRTTMTSRPSRLARAPPRRRGLGPGARPESRAPANARGGRRRCGLRDELDDARRPRPGEDRRRRRGHAAPRRGRPRGSRRPASARRPSPRGLRRGRRLGEPVERQAALATASDERAQTPRRPRRRGRGRGRARRRLPARARTAPSSTPTVPRPRASRARP